MIKNGTRLRSQVCETQVVVVRSTHTLNDLRCGGVAMTPIGEKSTQAVELHPTLAGGTLMGKRYVDDSGAEILVTKPGIGTLSTGAGPMTLKEAKPLPASD